MRIVSRCVRDIRNVSRVIEVTHCYFGAKTGRPKMKYAVVTNFGTANSFLTISS